MGLGDHKPGDHMGLGDHKPGDHKGPGDHKAGDHKGPGDHKGRPYYGRTSLSSGGVSWWLGDLRVAPTMDERA